MYTDYDMFKNEGRYAEFKDVNKAIANELAVANMIAAMNNPIIAKQMDEDTLSKLANVIIKHMQLHSYEMVDNINSTFDAKERYR